jgi:uncharacterized protein (DUF58 family)
MKTSSYHVTANLTGNGISCSIAELFYEGSKSKDADLHLKKKTNSLRAGVKRSSVRGRGMEFYESRPYVWQDEVRNIDWKVSARLSNLYTKIFTEEKERRIFVVVDLRRSMFFGSRNCFKSVLAAKIAARIAFAAINGGDQIGGFVFNEHKHVDCGLGAGRKSLARFLGVLSLGTKMLLEQEEAAQTFLWSSVIKRAVMRVGVDAQIFLISDFFDLDNEARPWLRSLLKKGDVFALSINDPLEEQLPALGRVGMAYGDKKLVFDSNDARLQKNYQEWSKEHKNRLKGILSSQNIPLIEFSTAQEPDEGLRRVFSGRW